MSTATNVTTQVLVETSEETHKHKDLVFQQHLRNLIGLYQTFVSNDTIKGVLEWEAAHLPKEGEGGHAE